MSGMASFLVGLGGGYIKSKDKQFERDRQAKIDERADFDHQQKVDAAKRDTKLRTELSDAGMQRTTMQGTVTEGAGQKLFSADPAQAAQLKNMTESIAELEGTGPVTQTQGTAITGNMSKGHEIATGPLDMKKLQELNSPQAIAERQAQTYNNNGRPLEANQMRTGAMDLKLKQLGLSKAEAEHADSEFNRMLATKVPMGKGWGANFAKVLTETGVGGLNGVTFSAVYSPDGKSFELIGTGPDGAKVSKGKFTEDDQGWANAMRQANSATLETKIGYVVEAGKAAREAEELEVKKRLAAAAETRANALEIKAIGGGGGSGSGSSNPKPLTAMDRALIVDRRTEARKSVDALREKLIEPLRRANQSGPNQATFKAQLLELQRQLADAESEFQYWDGQMNTMATDVVGRVSQGAAQPAQKPAAGAKVASLPQGAKQIGTSGGKPVYQTPDGKKFIAQ